MPVVNDPYAKFTDDELGQALKKKHAGVYDDYPDADLGKAMRVKTSPHLGDVSRQARKNLANILSEKTAHEYGEDLRRVWAQGVREIGTPIAAGAVGLATGGLGVAPVLAAGATAAAGEATAQWGAPTENVGRDIAIAGAVGGLSEFGGQLIGASIGKLAAKRAVSKSVEDADFESLAKTLGFPTKNVEGRVASGLQARVDAARRAVLAREADEIMKPLGSPLSTEMAGQEAAGVFKSIDEHFLGHARDLRNFVRDFAVPADARAGLVRFGGGASEAVGTAAQKLGSSDAALRETVIRAAQLKDELGKRAFRGMEDLEPFFRAMYDDRGAFKRFTVDEALALRTDIGREAARLGDRNPKKAMLDRLYGAMTEDIETVISARNPAVGQAFKQANADFSTYFKALKNEVAHRMMTAAKEGNGTAVVREFFKGDPEAMNQVFQFVQTTRPQEMGQFRQTIQRAALQNIFGIADDGAPALGYKLAERLDKIGTDRLQTIFGGSQEAAETLSRVKKLATLTSRFERSLKYPPDMSRQMDSGIKNLVMQAGVALAAKAWGAPYAAARIGAGALKGAGDLVLAELAVRPQLYQRFAQGWQKMANAVATPNLTASARAAMTRAGEAEVKAALGAASSMAAVKMNAEAKSAQIEKRKAERREAGQPQGAAPQVL